MLWPELHVAVAGHLADIRLVMVVAFPHHAAQEKAAPDALSEIAGQDVREAKNEERRD